jgi:phosphatidylserine/phosphatidylglycerophosphate/cardiolipin synthase-like enzyme
MKSHLLVLGLGALVGYGMGHGGSPGLATTAAPQIEVGFSPNGRAESLVITTIANARSRIEIAAYAFTSRPITEALIAARRRGVAVRLVADARSNQESPYARAAFGALLSAGAQVRLNDRYAIHHDKFVIADGSTLETGSFNFTASAASRNSENALVVAKAPKLVDEYLAHWQSRFDEATPYRSPTGAP